MSETFGTTVQNTTVAPAGERCDNFQGNFQCILRKGHAPPHSVDLGTFTAVTIGNGPKPKDPLQESLAAIRDAITSRDRHFDALGEQLRQGFEKLQSHQNSMIQAIAVWSNANSKQLERLEQRSHSFRGIEAGIVKLTTELPQAFHRLYDENAAFEAALKALGAQLEGIEAEQVDQNLIMCGINNLLGSMDVKLQAKIHNTLIPVRLETSELPEKRPAGRKKAKRREK